MSELQPRHIALTLLDQVYTAHRWRAGFSYVLVDTGVSRRYWWYNTADKAAAEAVCMAAAEANLAGAGVHVGLCRVAAPRDEWHGIRYEDAPVCACLWLDIDDTTLAGLAPVGVAPVAVWQTNPDSSYHCYWSLDGDYDAGRDTPVRRVLRGLARMTGGDVAAANGAHLRGWGTLHSKAAYAGYRLNLADDALMSGNYLNPDDCWPLAAFEAVAEPVIAVARPPAVWSTAANEQAVTLAELLARLANVKRRTATSYMASCPTARHAHGDQHQSLSIRIGEHGIVMKCFAGCAVEEICDALGLRVGQLFFERRTLDDVAYRRRLRSG